MTPAGINYMNIKQNMVSKETTNGYNKATPTKGIPTISKSLCTLFNINFGLFTRWNINYIITTMEILALFLWNKPANIRLHPIKNDVTIPM